jgi:hypothetical protein
MFNYFHQLNLFRGKFMIRVIALQPAIKTQTIVTVSLLSLVLVIFLAISASATTTSTTISSNLSAVISLLTSNGTVTINAIPTGTGVQTIASDTVTVSTNDASGYTLKLGETSASSALVSGGNSIAASTGNQTTPIAEVANSWGYRVDSLGGFGTGPTSAVSSVAIGALKFAAVPATASPDTLKTTATTASNDTTTVWYGIAANTTAPNGTYTNSVTYTATAN